MRKNFKKILLVLLIVFIFLGLIGCSKTKKSANVEFNNLLDEVLLDFVGSDPFRVNCVLKYPEALGLTNLTVKASTFLKEDKEAYYETLKDKRALILEFDDKCLSEDQILTKKIVIDYLKRQLLMEEFIGYESKLNSNFGYQIVLLFNLLGYRFDDLEDINNYFDYLRTTKETFENIISYETIRSNNNMGLTNPEIDAIISQCEDLINQEENFLIGIFNEKLNELSFLSEEEKISLKTENLNLINNDFINAYKYLKEALVLLKGKTTHNGALCNYPNGKEYYEARFRFNSGTDMTVLELEEYLKAKLNKLIAGYKASKEEYQEKFEINLMEGLEAETLVEYFQSKMENFPPLEDEIEYTIFEMSEAMQAIGYGATYSPSPIDANVKEVITINPNFIAEADNILFRTIAHEGFPGHLYQHAYFKNKDTHNVRKVIEYLAYAEGWTTYIENEIVGFVDSSAKKAMEFDNILGVLIICLLDIGIHYHGWDVDQGHEFMMQYYIEFPKEEFETTYNFYLQVPLLDIPYKFGYFQVQDLKADFKERLGENYSDLAFHKAFLDVGPAPFSILKEELGRYN